MSARALPEGFLVGHWSDPKAATGCTVIIPPEGSRCGEKTISGTAELSVKSTP